MHWKETYDWPPFDTPLDHPGNDTLGVAFESVTGEAAVYSGYKAVNDNGHIQHHYGVDSVSFGPGHLLMGAHAPDEHIDLEQLQTAATVYATMIAKWCGN
jgi:acetylornithine deacetylase